MTRRMLAVTLALAVLGAVACTRGAPAAAPSDVGGAPDDDTLTLALAGDVMFGRTATGGDRGWRAWPGERALRELAPRLGAADLTLVNLESPLCAAPEAAAAHGGVVLAGPAAGARWLASGGVDVAVVANNHGMDCGEAGLEFTEAALDEAGVAVAGIVASDAPMSTIARLDLPSVSVLAVSERAVPGARPGLRRPSTIPDHAALERALGAAVGEVRRTRPDVVVVVSLHWGFEMQPRPAGGQTALARSIIDAGAHVVMGHHPHVVQPLEVHGRGVIAYSLGNLWFDMPHPDARRTGVLDVELRRDAEGWRVASFAWHPLVRLPIDSR